MKKIIFISFFFFLYCTSFAQEESKNQGNPSRTIDSLLALLKNDKEDTLKALHLFSLCWEYKNIGVYETGLEYGNQALQLSQKLLYRFGIIYSHNNMGVNYQEQGNYNKALENYFAGLKLIRSGNEAAKTDKQAAANLFINIGVVYYEQGNYKASLENYLSALKIQQGTDDKNGIASSYGNIGIIYTIQGNYENALLNQAAALKIRKETGDERGLADSYINTGAIYESQGDAVESPEKKKQLFEKALENYNEAMEIKKKTGDKEGISSSSLSVGSIYVQEKKYTEAIEIFKQSLETAKEIGAKEVVKEASLDISDAYLQTKDYKLAYEYYKNYSDMKDTLFNEKSAQKTAEMSARYESTKKEEQIKLLEKDKEKQTAVADAESRKKNVIIGSIIGVLFLVILFSGFILRSLRITRKQKAIIESQKSEVELSKDLIEEKNKSITDSILYAERIQKSLLPTEKYIDRNLNRLRKK